MKKYALTFFSIILYACGGNTTETHTDFSNITFTIDTVLVDQGEEHLYLKWGLELSDLSQDKKYIYNFNLDDHTLEKINLDELVLEEKLAFEKEGPNGTGEYLRSLNVYKGNSVFLTGFTNVGLYNMAGEKTQSFALRETKFDRDSLKADEDFWKLVMDKQDGKLYGLIGNYSGSSFALGKIDYENKVLEKFSLGNFDKIGDYRFTLQSMMVMMPNMDMADIGGRLILSNLVTSELIWYDINRDSLFRKTFESKLTANEKKGKYRQEFDSNEELEKERRLMHQEINFMTPFFDEVNQRFYRFSYKELEPVSDWNSEEDTKAEVYLTILDKDLNMLHELPLPKLNKSPAKHFVKDGKIWIFENLDDEMGFVRLSLMY